MDQQLIDKVNAYQMPAAAISLLKATPPLLIAGTTGSGKTAVATEIEATSSYKQIVTSTTRLPRPGEQQGKDYWFITDQELLQLLDSQAMVEVKFFPEGSQTVYGISISAYEETVKAGEKTILTIDVRGIEDIMKFVHELKPVFILPPSFETWMERLDHRGAMSHVERLRRLHSARTELNRALTDEHFTLVVNQDIHRAAKEVIDGLTDPASQQRNRELIKQLIDHINAY